MDTPSFVNLLNSQNPVDLDAPEHVWMSSQSSNVDGDEEVREPEARPIGVKAAKAVLKRKKSSKELELSKLEALFEIKQKLSNQKILERLIAKQDPLSEMETSLKNKLMSEMLQ
ncbi:hypothetical protein YC2023_058192 [Brassica napus]